MHRSIPAEITIDRERFCHSPGLPPLNPLTLSAPPADSHRMVVDRDGVVSGRCSLWWSATPSYQDHRVGLIGHYAARDRQASAQLLEQACEILAQHGCSLAIGPMDGNAWQRYRLVIEHGSAPPFFLEPVNPDDWPDHFSQRGFEPLAYYSSALNSDLRQRNPRGDVLQERADAKGVIIRPLRTDDFHAELQRIYQVAIDSFRQNLLYSPIAAGEFAAQYAGIKPYLRPELVLIAEEAGAAVGFVFAIPDLLQAQRGQAIDTIVIKTLAVRPEHTGYGLGSLLVERCQTIAAHLGYRQAIHALMHEQNNSRRISDHYAATIRRYALFAKEL